MRRHPRTIHLRTSAPRAPSSAWLNRRAAPDAPPTARPWRRATLGARRPPAHPYRRAAPPRAPRGSAPRAGPFHAAGFAPLARGALLIGSAPGRTIPAIARPEGAPANGASGMSETGEAPVPSGGEIFPRLQALGVTHVFCNSGTDFPPII